MKRYYQSAEALGCLVELCVVDKNQKKAELLLQKLWTEIASFSNYFSRFNEKSELSVFNKLAGQEVRISKDFAQMLMIAKEYASKTNGLFNIFVLPALQKSGYVDSFNGSTKTDQSINFSNRQVVDMSLLEVHGYMAKIPENSAIDLGGIGKGFLANKLADFIESKVRGYWFSIGGDIICAGNDELGNDWKISLLDTNSNIIGNVTNRGINRFAVATSGTTKRRGKNWHHIIDPRINKPSVNSTALVTVVDSDIIKVDILATCSVIETIENSKSMLSKFEVIDALFQEIDQQNKLRLSQINDTIEVLDKRSMEGFNA